MGRIAPYLAAAGQGCAAGIGKPPTGTHCTCTEPPDKGAPHHLIYSVKQQDWPAFAKYVQYACCTSPVVSSNLVLVQTGAGGPRFETCLPKADSTLNNPIMNTQY